MLGDPIAGGAEPVGESREIDAVAQRAAAPEPPVVTGERSSTDTRMELR